LITDYNDIAYLQKNIREQNKVSGYGKHSNKKSIINFIQIYTKKPQIRAIHIYEGYTKVTTDHRDIRLLVIINFIGYHLRNG